MLPAPSASLASWFYDGVNQLAERAAQCGTKILVENVPVTFAPLASDLSTALGELADERVGVVYDVANGFFAGEDPASGIQTLRDRIDLIHLSDTGRKSTGGTIPLVPEKLILNPWLKLFGQSILADSR